MTGPLVRLRRRGALRPAAVAAGLALALSSCGISLQSLPKIGGISGPTYTVDATFANVVNLPANAQVRVGAFAVGYVSNIGLQDFQAVVTMKIKKSTRLPVGTRATVGFDTPLGEDFVSLETPSSPAAGGPYLTDGSRITEAETTTAPSVEDTFGALGALLNGGGINQLQTIIQQTNLAVDSNQGAIRNLVQNLDSTVGSFAQNTPSIDNALSAISSLSQLLEQGTNTVTQGIDALGPAASVLSSETGDINSLVTQLSSLSSAADSIINASTSGTIRTVQALDPLLTQLTDVNGELQPALAAVTALEQKTPAVIPGNYVQLSIKANVELPAVPSDALPLQRVTVDPPDPNESYTASAVSQLIEGGLP